MARRRRSVIAVLGAAALTALAAMPASLAQPATPAVPSSTQPAATQPAATQPTASEVFDRLLGADPVRDSPPLQPVAPPAPPNRAGAAPAAAPGGPAQAVAREGTYLMNRVGRLTRAADGTWEFTFDADGRAMQDPPLKLLENLKLAQMEDAVAGANRDLRFRVTGMLTEYRGRNYVMIEKFIVLSEDRRAF